MKSLLVLSLSLSLASALNTTVINESGFVFERGQTPGMLIVSILSMIASVLVLSTSILLPYARKKTSISLIYYIVISDFMTALGSSVGTPLNHSSTCYFEGIVTNIFTLSSIFWCLVITFLLYSIVSRGKQFDINIYMHLFCWGFPIVVTLLPFINTNYGGSDDDGGSWCFIVDDDRSGEWDQTIWFWLAFYLWIWLSILTIIIIIGIVWFKTKYQIKEDTKEDIRLAIRRLIGYPLIITLVWAVSTAYDTLTTLFPGQQFEGYDVMKFLATVYPCSQGFFIAIYFFIVQSDVRNDSIEVIRGFLTTGNLTPKITSQSGRRRSSIYSRKVFIDASDSSYRLGSESPHRIGSSQSFSTNVEENTKDDNYKVLEANEIETVTLSNDQISVVGDLVVEDL